MNLTDAEREAITIYEGKSSQVLALLLTQARREHAYPFKVVVEYNDMLRAVRLERGR